MRTILIFSIVISLAASVFSGCSKDERIMYKEDPRVYFTKNVVNADSVIYSFGVKPVEQVTDTVLITLRIMGDATDYDREINIAISDTSTAKAGYHFSFGPLIMPADSFQVRIPVYLYKQPGLKDSIVTIDLEIAESKDFKPGYSDIPSTIYRMDRLHYKISLTDQLLKPAVWDSRLAVSFGTYSEVKFRFMILATAKTEWNNTIFPGDLNFLIQKVKYALYEYEQANGPMIDENGSRVEFP